MDSIEYYLEQCRHRIEVRLQWADSKHWRHQEFLLLSDKIYEKTGVALSVNTLKRLWGKVAYSHHPNTSTLNTLANFLDFENWVEFIAYLQGKEEALLGTPTSPALIDQLGRIQKQGRRFIESIFALAILGLLYIVAQGMLQVTTQPGQEAMEKVKFSSEKVVRGVPNTVLFSYDLKGIQGDHFYIQQTWDARRKFEIDPQKKEVASTYYYPGYWRAKILADTTILKEHDLVVESDGWLLTMDGKDQPRYFLDDEWQTGNGLSIQKEVYNQAILGKEELPWFTLHYIDDFENLEMDNLELELELQNDYRSGLAPCQHVRIVVLGSENFFSIPLSQPGCSGDLRLRLADITREGHESNLTAFGRDLNLPQRLKVKVQDRKVSLYLNGELIEEDKYNSSAGTFHGLRIKFKGHGRIHSVKVKRSMDQHDALVLWPLVSQ